MNDNFVRAYDLRDAVAEQLYNHAVLADQLPKPAGEDDEQWAFPYGRLTFESWASYETEYGTFSAFVFVSGIVEESGLTGKLFLDKDGVCVRLETPEGEECHIEWAEEDIVRIVDKLRGGYEFWNLPLVQNDTSFISFLIDDSQDSEHAGIALSIAKAFAEQVNYKNIITA